MNDEELDEIMSEVSAKVFFADSPTGQLEPIMFNRPGALQVYYELSPEGQRVILAGIPEDMPPEEYTELGEYITAVISDPSFQQRIQAYREAESVGEIEED